MLRDHHNDYYSQPYRHEYAEQTLNKPFRSWYVTFYKKEIGMCNHRPSLWNYEGEEIEEASTSPGVIYEDLSYARLRIE